MLQESARRSQKLPDAPRSFQTQTDSSRSPQCSEKFPDALNIEFQFQMLIRTLARNMIQIQIITIVMQGQKPSAFNLDSGSDPNGGSYFDLDPA